MPDYTLFGWRVQSTLPLPELLPWRGGSRAPDLVVEVGAVPPVDLDTPSFNPALQICPTGVRVAIPAVATYWVEAGRRVIVQPTMPEDATDIRVFLLGTVLALLCFQRGLLPLHASAVDIGGQALLLSGVSGAGKSTLAAAFSGRGYRLLSDDLCALEMGRDSRSRSCRPSRASSSGGTRRASSRFLSKIWGRAARGWRSTIFRLRKPGSRQTPCRPRRSSFCGPSARRSSARIRAITSFGLNGLVM